MFGSAGGSLDMEKVSQLALYFVYIAIASGVAAYFQVRLVVAGTVDHTRARVDNSSDRREHDLL